MKMQTDIEGLREVLKKYKKDSSPVVQLGCHVGEMHLRMLDFAKRLAALEKRIEEIDRNS